MSDQRPGQVVGRTPAGTVARGLLHVVFSVPHELVPLMWQNRKVLFNLLFEASAATLLEVAADPKHLGAEIGFLSVLHTWGQNSSASSPHPLCDPVWWSVAGPPALDRIPLPLLPAGESSQPCLSRQVRGRPAASLSQTANSVSRSLQAAGSASKAFLCFPAHFVPSGLGGLRQATLRRAGTRAALSGPLHASRRHLQPSSGRSRPMPT